MGGKEIADPEILAFLLHSGNRYITSNGNKHCLSQLSFSVQADDSPQNN